jgi:hypothetical protein
MLNYLINHRLQVVMVIDFLDSTLQHVIDASFTKLF